MLTISLILVFLFVAGCATVKFEYSLKENGSLPRKIFVFIKDAFDALFGLG